MQDVPPPEAAASDARPAAPAGPDTSQTVRVGGQPDSRRARALRRTASLLGLGGLLPFAALALAATALEDDWALAAADTEAQYAASILSFIGALHWGVALAAPTMSTARTRLALVWSVMPSLYAWAAVVLPRLAAPVPDAVRATLVLLAAGLVVAWAVDEALYRGHPVPAWFRRLRAMLTTGALVALLVTLMA